MHLRRKLGLVLFASITVLAVVATACTPPSLPTPAPTPAPTTPAPATPTATAAPTTPALTTPATTPAVKLPPVMSFATAGIGTTSYIAASAFSEVLNNYLGIKASVEPSGATSRWVPLMKTKDIDFAMGCALLDVQDAYYGVGYWADKGGPQPVLHAATGHTQPYGFLVTDPKIKSLADLKGKKLYTDIKGLRVQNDTVRLLLKAVNIKPEDLELMTFVDVNEAAQGIANGKAVGIFYLPTALPLVELDRAKPLYGVPIPKEIVDKVVEEMPTWGFMTWKKGDGIGKENIPFLSQPCGMEVRADMDSDVVYTVLSAIYNHYDAYKDKHAIMSQWTPAQAVSVVPLPFHPGAIKFFKEKGVWQADQEKQNQKLAAKLHG